MLQKKVRSRGHRHRDQDRADGAVQRAASSFAIVARIEAAYLQMINSKSGINGRKIELIQLDDAYSPPRAVEQQ